jgi:hypothetical protein
MAARTPAAPTRPTLTVLAKAPLLLPPAPDGEADTLALVECEPLVPGVLACVAVGEGVVLTTLECH